MFNEGGTVKYVIRLVAFGATTAVLAAFALHLYDRGLGGAAFFVGAAAAFSLACFLTAAE
jgi:hypothetical protein